ncbi:glycosyl hydrolase family 8 [Duganella radicis]|uniref:glycosyl hydrolase family 8 n=1 Tax=Duganella radicis TaxID=551988 RepID=UPI0035312A79
MWLLGVAGGAQAASAVTGQYRNVFREWRPALTERMIDAKIDGYWRSLFEGDADSRIYYPAAPTADGPSAYIKDIGNDDVRSEGMSYGLMIAVQMNRQREFDALWNWMRTHMRYQDGPRRGYFRWQCRPPGCAGDAAPASDGEEYTATALLMASARWGDGEGIYDYGRQADELLAAMLHKEAMNGGVVGEVRSIFPVGADQVVFVPIGGAAEFTDPSYHLPAFYELWARRGGAADRARWRKIAETSRHYFQLAAHPQTGLTPEYAEFDGRPRRQEGHGDFRFDAFRTAVNWSVDQAWWGRNPWAAELSARLLGFFQRQGDGPYPAQYAIDGTVLDRASSSGLIACNAVATLALDGPPPARFVADLWNLAPPRGKWRYYDGLLQFMAMLHLSGRFVAYQ